MNEIHKIFNPRGVAVIGASSSPHKWGYLALKELIAGGFKGGIYPINPKGGEILGKKAYASVLDVEGLIDTAFILIPKAHVAGAVEECAKKGITGIVVDTSGFAEKDSGGKDDQQRLVETAREYGSRIIGPNCMGLYSHSSLLNLCAEPYVPELWGAKGVSIVSQSGNLAISLFREAMQKDIKFSKFLSIGNQSDLKLEEVIEYLGQDDETKVIMSYIEGVNDGKKFLNAIRKASLNKPVIILKSGRTKAGSRSVASHTASIAGDDIVFDYALRQAGGFRVDNYDEFLDMASVFLSGTSIEGPNVLVFGDGGGHVSLMADAVESNGLGVPELSEKTKQELSKIVTEESSIANPIDLASYGDKGLEIYEEILEAGIQDDNIQGVIQCGLFGGFRSDLEEIGKSYKEVAESIGRHAKRFKKPVFLQSIYADDFENENLRMLRQNGIPVFSSMERPAKCMANLWNYKAGQVDAPESFGETKIENEDIRRIIKAAREEGRTNLLETEARELLAEIGLTSSWGLAGDEQKAVRLAEDLGYPVALKIVSDKILHKSDIGGVRLGLKTGDEVAEAFRDITAKAKKHADADSIKGCLVSPMVRSGVEIIIGMNTDPSFGPVVMVGMGGVLVELLKDVTLGVAPVSKEYAENMIRNLKGYQLLESYRGSMKKDVGALTDALYKIGCLVDSYKEIKEIDLNPVKVMEEGLELLDARIILNG